MTDLKQSAVAPDLISRTCVSAAEFRNAFRNHPGGVALITATYEASPVAMTVSSLVSVSADPPLLAFSLSDHSAGSRFIRRAGRIVVHFLASGQLELAKLGATGGVDRFADTSIWSYLPTGEPYFYASPIRLLCNIVHEVRAGGSTVAIAQAQRLVVDSFADTSAQDSPLVYHNRRWHALSTLSEID